MQFSYLLLSEHPEYIDNYKAVIPDRINFNDTGFDGIGAADEEGNPCGIVLVDLAPGVCTIDWIYVCQDYRRQGVGRGLLTALFTMAEDNFPNFEVQFRYICLDARPDGSVDDDNDLFRFLLSDTRFQVQDIYPCMSISPDACHASPGYMKLAGAGVGPEVVPFFETLTSVHRTFLTRLEKERKYEVTDYHIWKSTLVKDLCLCVVRNGEIKAGAFVKGDTGNLLVDYLYGENPNDLQLLISSIVSQKEAEYPDSNLMTVLFTDVSTQIYRMIFRNSGSVKYMIFSLKWNHRVDV